MKIREILFYLSLIFVAGMAFGQLCSIDHSTFEKFAQFGSGISGLAAIFAVVAAFIAIDRWKHEHLYKATYEKIELIEEALRKFREASIEFFEKSLNFQKYEKIGGHERRISATEEWQVAHQNYLLHLKDYQYKHSSLLKQPLINEHKLISPDIISSSVHNSIDDLDKYLDSNNMSDLLDSVDSLYDAFNDAEDKLDSLRRKLQSS